MKPTYLLFVAVLFLAVALIPSRAQVGAPAAERVQRIATVNPAEVFDRIMERKDAQAVLDTKVVKLRDEDRFRRDELETIRHEVFAVKPGSPLYKKLTDELRKKTAEYEVWSKVGHGEMEQSEKEMMVELYQKIARAVQTEAKKKGYDLVLAKEVEGLPDDLTRHELAELRAMIQRRAVIYDSGVSDLTLTVVGEMDREYARPAP